MTHAWVEELPAAITVCDKDGLILELNALAASNRASDGGKDLVGKNMMDCHPEHAREGILALLRDGKQNVYFLEVNGVRKLVLQSPWFQEGEYQGFVSISLEVPGEIPFVVRG